MEAIVTFFRDVLSGTLYVIVSIVCFILICICIWQLIRRNKKAKQVEEEFASSHVVMINANGEEETIEVSSSVSITQGSSFMPNIISPTTSVQNVVTNSADIGTTNSLGMSSDSFNKPVAVINPAEVAAVSSTMNVIGVTSAQKSVLQASNNQYVINTPGNVNVANVESNPDVLPINDQVASMVSNNSIDNSRSQHSNQG